MTSQKERDVALVRDYLAERTSPVGYAAYLAWQRVMDAVPDLEREVAQGRVRESQLEEQLRVAREATRGAWAEMDRAVTMRTYANAALAHAQKDLKELREQHDSVVADLARALERVTGAVVPANAVVNPAALAITALEVQKLAKGWKPIAAVSVKSDDWQG